MKKVLTLCLLSLLFACDKGSDSSDNPSKPDQPCLITGIDLLENPTPDRQYAVNNSVGKIMEIKSAGKTLSFSYNIEGLLVEKWHKEATSTYTAQSVIGYWNTNDDSDGKLAIITIFKKPSNAIDIFQYKYLNGRISEIEYYDGPYERTWTSKEVLTWENGNIASIKYIEGQDSCTYSFTYDLSKVNPLSSGFPDLMWQEPIDDYEEFDDALFLSKNLVTKMTTTCTGGAEVSFSYTFNSRNQVKAIKVNGVNTWTFKYSCD